MGKKLGAAFIIYGILNMVAAIVLLAFMPLVGIGGIVWSVVIIALGKWMRSSAKRNEERDELLKRIADNTNNNNNKPSS